jgi:REP element-mobilizing transposase RayT
MKPKKEHYRQKLPHFQQPGQWYSVTVSLEGAIPKSAMAKYSLKLAVAKDNYKKLLAQAKSPTRDMDFLKSMFLQSEFKDKNLELGNSKSQLADTKAAYYTALRNYRLAYDKFLHKSTESTISLIKPINQEVIEEALRFWESKKLHSHAWCIMSNHFHWVLTVFEKDESGEPIYLQDILHSVKLFTAKRINKAENLNGQLWAHESFETTIRNNEHFANVFNYVINNPVSARLVEDWKNWPGTWTEDMDFPKLTTL